MPEHRIISLIASATEIVSALGFEQSLVGRSHECDFPHSVERLPVCSEAKLDVRASSREIDNRVKAILRDALSVYRVLTDKLDELRPTVIITQTQCEVCAVSLKDVEQAVCEMVTSRPKIVALEPMCLADVWGDIRRVAEALGASEQGEKLIAALTRRLEAIRKSAADSRSRPRVACIEWIDPLMSCGNWVPELVEIAGGENLFGEAGKHSPWMMFEDLVARDPDIIIVMPCGFDIPRTQIEMPPLSTDPRWHDLRAVRTGQVYLADGNQYFNRPGPRLVESAEILVEVFHPTTFDFGHQGSGWVPWKGLGPV